MSHPVKQALLLASIGTLMVTSPPATAGTAKPCGRTDTGFRVAVNGSATCAFGHATALKIGRLQDDLDLEDDTPFYVYVRKPRSKKMVRMDCLATLTRSIEDIFCEHGTLIVALYRPR